MFELDLSELVFCPDSINSLGELLYDEVIMPEDVQNYLQIFTGVVAKTSFGFLGEDSIVGVPHKGCQSDPQDYSIAARKVDFDPKKWEILIGICFTDFEQTAAVYSMNTGVRMSELQDTDIFIILLNALALSVRKMMVRFAWFNDTDADHFANGGEYTDTILLDYFHVNDGLWKRIFVATENTEYHIPIAENAGTSYAAQKFASDVVELFDNMIDVAGTQLAASPNARFYVTSGIARAYRRYLQDPCCLQSARDAMLNGVTVTSYEGYPVIEMKDWTLGIAEYQNDVTNGVYFRPNRALFTVRNAMGMAVDAENSFSIKRIWYEKKDRMEYIEMMGRVDTQILAPQGWVVAAY